MKAKARAFLIIPQRTQPLAARAGDDRRPEQRQRQQTRMTAIAFVLDPTRSAGPKERACYFMLRLWRQPYSMARSIFQG